MYHKTTQGEIMPIYSMDDKHLLNTINLYIRILEESKNILNGEKEQNQFNKILYKDRQNMIVAAEKYVQLFNEKISPYFFEALIRNFNLDKQIKNLQMIIGRECAIPKVKLLSINQDEDSWDEEEEFPSWEDVK